MEELCILFNSILRHTHVSQMFKVGKVISLFKGKKKDRSNSVNYRGVTYICIEQIVWKGKLKVNLSNIENYLLDSVFHLYNLEWINHGATPACNVLKETIGYHTGTKGPLKESGLTCMSFE